MAHLGNHTKAAVAAVVAMGLAVGGFNVAHRAVRPSRDQGAVARQASPGLDEFDASLAVRVPAERPQKSPDALGVTAPAGCSAPATQRAGIGASAVAQGGSSAPVTAVVVAREAPRSLDPEIDRDRTPAPKAETAWPRPSPLSTDCSIDPWLLRTIGGVGDRLDWPVAEVRVTRKYPPRGDTESGKIATPIWPVPPRGMLEGRSWQWLVIRADVVRWLWNPRADTDGVIVSKQLSSGEGVLSLPESTWPAAYEDIAVGDHLVLFMAPFADETLGSTPQRWTLFPRSEAARLSRPGEQLRGIDVLLWYELVDGRIYKMGECSATVEEVIRLLEREREATDVP